MADVCHRVKQALTNSDIFSGIQVKDAQRVLDALAQLDKVDMTETLLKETKIVFPVKALLDADNVLVVSTAQSILRKWKRIKSTVSSTNVASSSSVATLQKNASVMASSSKTSALPDANEISASMLRQYGSVENRRLKSAELLAKALMTGQQAVLEIDSVTRVTVKIERQIDKMFATDNNLYKNKVLSLVSNFKQNEQLRLSTVIEHIPAERLCAMTASELASDEKRKEIEQLHKEIKLNSVEAKPSEAETTQFQCGKCKQRRCTYYQLQTRSADEPMTTFVTCLECGNKWRF